LKEKILGVPKGFRLSLPFFTSLTLVLSSVSAAVPDRIGVRILFGIADLHSTQWDGSVTVKDAQRVS
jgi:hypothetical protein